MEKSVFFVSCIFQAGIYQKLPLWIAVALSLLKKKRQWRVFRFRPCLQLPLTSSVKNKHTCAKMMFSPQTVYHYFQNSAKDGNVIYYQTLLPVKYHDIVWCICRKHQIFFPLREHSLYHAIITWLIGSMLSTKLDYWLICVQKNAVINCLDVSFDGHHLCSK